MDWFTVNDKVKRQIVADGEKLMLVKFHFDLGGQVASHSHMHEQISYVVSGFVRFTRDGKEIDVHAGEGLLLPSNSVHSAVAVEESTVVESFSPPREDFRPK